MGDIWARGRLLILLQKRRLLAIAAVALIAAAWLMFGSEIFQNCVRNNSNEQPNGSALQGLAHLFWVSRWCSGVFLKENSEALTAMATAVMAIFTGTLWWATTEQGKLSQKAITLSTHATEATIAAERARFHVIVEGHNLHEFIRLAEMYNNSPKMATSGDIRIVYRFKNYGKGPGLITSVSHGTYLSETAPEDLIYTVVRQVPEEYMVASLEQTERQYCDATLPINSMADAIDIRAGRKLIWFFGRFDYVDFVTNGPQVHRFLLRYVQTENEGWRFQTFDWKHYNQST